MVDYWTPRSRARARRLVPPGLLLTVLVTGCSAPGMEHDSTTWSSWTPQPEAAAPKGHGAHADGASGELLAGSWTLSALLERVRLVTPSAESMAAATDRAEAALALARSAFGLQLDFDLTATYSDNPALAFMGELNAGELDLAGGLGDTGWTPHGQAGLHAGTLLWDGGRRRAQEAAALEGVEASRAASLARALGSEAQVVNLYLGLRESRALEAAAEGRLAAVDGALEAAQARLDAGSGLASERDSLEARRAVLEEALLIVRSNQEEGRAALLILLGAGNEATQRAHFQVDLDAPLGSWSHAGVELPALSELTDLAHRTRPDLAALSSAVAARRESLTASERSSGPTVSAFADAWLDGSTPLAALDRGSANVGAQLNWSLIDGGLRDAHEAVARAELRAARALLAEAVEAVELEVLRARRGVELAILRGATARRGEASAQRALEELGAGFEAGQVSLERWLGAESDAGEARARVVQAQVREELARAHLTLSLGRSLVEHDSPELHSRTPETASPR